MSDELQYLEEQAEEKVKQFTDNSIVADNAEMATLWNAVRLMAWHLKQVR